MENSDCSRPASTLGAFSRHRKRRPSGEPPSLSNRRRQAEGRYLALDRPWSEYCMSLSRNAPCLLRNLYCCKGFNHLPRQSRGTGRYSEHIKSSRTSDELLCNTQVELKRAKADRLMHHRTSHSHVDIRCMDELYDSFVRMCFTASTGVWRCSWPQGDTGFACVAPHER